MFICASQQIFIHIPHVHKIWGLFSGPILDLLVIFSLWACPSLFPKDQCTAHKPSLGRMDSVSAYKIATTLLCLPRIKQRSICHIASLSLLPLGMGLASVDPRRTFIPRFQVLGTPQHCLCCVTSAVVRGLFCAPYYHE